MLSGKFSLATLLLFVAATSFGQSGTPPATIPVSTPPAAAPAATTPPPAPRPAATRPAAPPSATTASAAPTTAATSPAPRTRTQPTAPPAETNIPGPVWKKQVTRDIEMGEKIDTNLHRLRPAGTDNTLLEMLAIGIKSGRVSSYSIPEFLMPNRLNQNDFNKLFIGRPDTTAVRDAQGRYTMKIFRREFSYSHVHKYRILEEWTSYPAIGKTEIQIIGLAPLLDAVAPDGSVTGVSPLFWVRYTEDIKALLARYDQYHPNNTLGGHLWDSYFMK